MSKVHGPNHESCCGRKSDPDFESWLDANFDRVSETWTEYLEYKRDSREAVLRLANSDQAFREFAESLRESEMRRENT